MSTEHEAWERLEVRTPGDVPPVTPLSWLVAKHGGHAGRLMNNRLPADFPHPVARGTAGDALAVLALEESIRREAEQGRGTGVLAALELGASWPEVAAALDVDQAEARALLRAWAEGQHRLYRGDVEKGRPRPFGLDADRYAAVLALCERADDEPDAATPRDPVELEEMIAAEYADDPDA